MLLTRDNRKISIIGGLLLIGLTLITGIVVYDVMRQQIELSLGRGLDVALQGKGHLLESQIERTLADTQALAVRPFLVQSMQQLHAQSDDSSALKDLERVVYSLMQSGFSAAAVYNLHGNILSQAGHFSEKYTQSLPLNKLTNTFLIWDGKFILHTDKEVFDQDGERIGSITTESTLPHLTRSFGEIRTIGETGVFMLCAPPKESDKNMACLTSKADGIKFKYLASMVEEGGVLPMNYALDGKRGVMAIKDYQQVPVIEAYAPLHNIGWGMILKLNKDELFKPVTKELKIVIFYLAGLIVAEIFLLNWFIRKLINSEREVRSAKEKAEQSSLELSRKELELRERLKEMTCLYEIRRSTGLELSIENVCLNIFEHLIPAMQFPEIATVVIEINDKRYTSENYRQNYVNEVETSLDSSPKVCHRCYRHDATIGPTLQSEITINEKICGHLRVFYPKEKPFMIMEEQKLVDTIAVDLSRWLERKRLEQTLIFVAEEQAQTIGQELHDNLGQQIAAVGYQAGALEKKILASGSEEMALVAASIATQAQTAVIQIKQLAQGLLPFELEANGLITALEKLASRIASTYATTCDFLCENKIIISDKNTALNLYRIAQEAVNNAIRHGDARHLIIALSHEREMLNLSISDDGCGFLVKNSIEETQGMGIKIMQYRAKQLGGILEFLPRIEGGMKVSLKMRMT